MLARLRPSTAPPRQRSAGALRARRRIVGIALAIGLAAFGIRLVVVLVTGRAGVLGLGDYDDGVYFAAADLLVHGRVPYRDFLLLQPPGIVLVLAPFAALGGWIGEADAFGVARVAFIAVGGCNAALVVLVLRRSGAAAAAAGGLLWACSIPAIVAERSILLEPLGSLGLLVALVLRSLHGRRAAPWWPDVLAGTALGLSIGVKIWQVVPAVIVVAFGGRAALRVAAGVIAAVVAVHLPFFVLDPAGMWRQVVTDQLGRPRSDGGILDRLGTILQPPTIPGVPTDAVLGAQIALVVVLCVLARARPGAPLLVVLLVAAIALLLLAPSFYGHYAALALPPLVLVCGTGIGVLIRRFRAGAWRTAASGAAVAAAGLACLATWPGSAVSTFGRPGVPPSLTRAVAAVGGCVASDDPTVLILTGALTRDIARGCAIEPDVSGRVYDLDARRVGGTTLPAASDVAYQDDVLAYFRRSEAVVLCRSQSFIEPGTVARLAVGRPLWTGSLNDEPARLVAVAGRHRALRLSGGGGGTAAGRRGTTARSGRGPSAPT